MKEAISMVKRQHSEWEKILIKANGTTDWNNLQNIQAAHVVQCQKNKQAKQEADRKLKQTFLQIRHILYCLSHQRS